MEAAGNPRSVIPAECHEEGKDVGCGHILATMSGLLEHEALETAGDPALDSDVQHCFLDIALDFTARRISGSNTLTVRSLASGVSTFSLDLGDHFAIDSVEVNGLPASFSRPGDALSITLDRTYNTGEIFDVTVAYHGSPGQSGFTNSFWYPRSGTATLAASLSQPWYAKEWWPCRDDLRDKFTLDFWITVPSGKTAISNGVLQGTDSLPGNRIRYRWHESHPIATYLVSVAASQYTRWAETYVHPSGSMPVDIYGYSWTSTDVQTHLGILMDALEIYSRPEVFGEYPFVDEKYGIAEFSWGGGMEHQTISSQGTITNIRRNVHELAHQWWGDLVTCGTWHDVWLNEGFASYAEALYEEMRPGGGPAAYLSQMYYRWPDESGSVYVYDDSTQDAVFDTGTVYNKGAWVMHMLRHVVGDADFFNTLAAYRAAYAHGFAVTDDFKAVAESVCSADLDWFFDEWVYGRGSPSYRYGWEYKHDGNQHTLRLHMRQYQTAYNLFRMPIDITVVTDLGPQTHVVWQALDWNWYVLPADGPVVDVLFDNDSWILRADATREAYVSPPLLRILTTWPRIGAQGTSAMRVNRVEIFFDGPVSYTSADFTVSGSVSGGRTFITDYDPERQCVRLLFDGLLAAAEKWTVTVADSLLGLATGQPLDGEIADPQDPASLPSGDGIPGGTAAFSFTTGFTGDLDGDRDVDQEDFSRLQICLEQPGVIVVQTACLDADLDHDRDVDLADLAIFQDCLTGAGLAPDARCGE